MQPVIPLQPASTYHIFTRGNNREEIFFEERNYRYFLQLYTRYILPIVDTFAYCLMRNHFHLLVRIKTSKAMENGEAAGITSRQVSQAFSNLLNAYAKAINKTYGRSGSLFEERFERIEVTSDAYFAQLVFYIHYNPQKHGFVDDFRHWPWSSYSALISQSDTHLERNEVLGWFLNVEELKSFHDGQVDVAQLRTLVENDF